MQINVTLYAFKYSEYIPWKNAEFKIHKIKKLYVIIYCFELTENNFFFFFKKIIIHVVLLIYLNIIML